jgi:hypothetical protein
MSTAAIGPLPEENDRTVRQALGQNDETPRISPGHGCAAGQLF